MYTPVDVSVLSLTWAGDEAVAMSRCLTRARRL